METQILNTATKAGKFVREQTDNGLVVAWATRPLVMAPLDQYRLALDDGGGNYGFYATSDPTDTDIHAIRVRSWQRDDARFLMAYTNDEILAMMEERLQERGYSLERYRELMGDHRYLSNAANDTRLPYIEEKRR